MPYVLRNKNGQIKSFHKDAPSPKAERMDTENYQEIIEFLKETDSFKETNSMNRRVLSSDEVHQILSSSDLSIVRVLEDVIDLLCKNHIITFTNLPDYAQKKLTDRKIFRAEMSGIENLIADEKDDGIF